MSRKPRPYPTRVTQDAIVPFSPDHTITATSADFTLTERLVNATGISFSATVP